MKHIFYKLLLGLSVIIILTGCSVTSRTMKTPNYHIEFYAADFDYSPQLSAKATSEKIFMIDWSRLFQWKTGNLSSDRFQAQSQNIAISGNVIASSVIGTISTVIPVLGDYGKGKVSSYALYNLMQENPGYDVVVYPQYEARKFFIPLIYSKTKVVVKARLGKIK